MPLDYAVFGGEVPKLHARNLENGYAELALDADVTRGTILPLAKDKLLNGTLVDRQFLMVEDCEVVSSDRCISVARVTIPCTHYFRTGAAGHPEQTRKLGGPWHRLGFPVLQRAPIVTIARQTRTVDKVIRRQFIYTLIDIYDQESQASAPSEVIVSDWDNVALVSGFVIPPDPPIKQIRVYSTAPNLQTDETPKADSNSFYRVAELPPTTLAFEHQPLSTGYGEVYLNHNFYPPPSNLEQVQYWGENQIAGLSAGQLMFSQPLAYHAWPIDYTLSFHSPALAWVATEKYGYVMTCGFPEVVDMRHDCEGGKCHQTEKITEQFPILGIKSAVAHDNSAIYASKDGLVMLTGNRARLLTANIFTAEQWLAIHPNTLVGVVHDGFYIGVTDNFAFRLRVPDEAYEANPRNLMTSLSIRPRAIYRSTDDRVFFADAAGIWEMGAGLGRKPYRWRGPIEEVDARRLLGGGEILIDGNATVRLLRDGRVIWERPTTGGAFRLPTWIHGGQLQVEIEGTGEVSRFKLGASKSVLATLR